MTSEKEAEDIYNAILEKQIVPLVGNKTTYLTDLSKVCRKLLGIKFKGVFPSDKIPILNDLTPYCILNLDKSTESGSHWISVAKKDNKNEIMVYDSFGRTSKKIIPILSHSGNGTIKNTDLDAEQKIEETNCGARCIAWLVLYEKYGPDTAKKI